MPSQGPGFTTGPVWLWVSFLVLRESERDALATAPYCFAVASGLMRVSSAIQFTSQLLPPSSEKDCSKWQESALMSDQTLRTRMVRPLKSSWSKNSPRPFLNSPIVGTLKRSDAAVGEIQAPLMRLRIVEAQG